MESKFYLSPILLAVALSPAFLQGTCSPKSGNPDLLTLQIEAGGIDRLVGFDTDTLTYSVWLDGAATFIVRATAEDPNTAIGVWPTSDVADYVLLGNGSGETTIDTPADGTVIIVQTKSSGNIYKSFQITINPQCTADECDDNDQCTADSCVASTCDFTNEPDGTICDFASVGDGRCTAGTCLEPPVVPLTVAMTDNAFIDVHIFPFNLNVVPTSPIIANQPFTADLSGSVELPEWYLDVWQLFLTGGTTDVAIVDLKATVQTRGSGATGADVALGWDDTGFPYECGLSGGTCDPQNDQAGIPGIRPNSDCVPTGDFNPCNRYVDPPISTDCAPGGVCDGLGKLATQCAANGFCVTGDLLLPLQPVLGASYVAGDGVSPGQTEALFGWADNPPPATAVGVPAMDGDGTWNMLDFSSYQGAVGELGIRIVFSDTIILSFEGVMGTDSGGPAGVGVPDDASPMPSSSLVSFPVMQP